MPRTKLLKIKRYSTLVNTFDDSCKFKGKWLSEHFKNSNPIVLELGAGAANLSISLATKYANKNYIAVDIKSDRLYIGALKALLTQQYNIAFLKCRIEEIKNYFTASEIQELWITFPDPQPKKCNEKHRLLNRNFLSFYRDILSQDSKIYFKTDSDMLYNYAIDEIAFVKGRILEISHDVHSENDVSSDILIKTIYEQRFIDMGKTIKYLCFSLF
ncbi:MAG: tRNA (guanosine(46)-N7)-methyltransferase TrmB [Solitalea-like symbiont of Tyrophagus putrescentiae]